MMESAHELTPPNRQHERLWRTVLFSFGFVVVVFSLLIQFTMTGGEPAKYANSHSHSPAGHLAIFELLTNLEQSVERRYAPLGSQNVDENTCVVMLDPLPDYLSKVPEGYATNLAKSGCHVVIVLPKRGYTEFKKATVADLGNEPLTDNTEVLDSFSYEEEIAEKVLKHLMPEVELELVKLEGSYQVRGSELMIEDPQVFSTDENAPGYGVSFVVRDTEANELAAPRDIENKERRSDTITWVCDDFRGNVTIVSDPDAFTNRYIDRDGAADFVLDTILSTRPQHIILDETAHGFWNINLRRVMTRPPGLWVTLSALLLLFLFGWREKVVLGEHHGDDDGGPGRARVVEGTARLLQRSRDPLQATSYLRNIAGKYVGERRPQLYVGGSSLRMRGLYDEKWNNTIASEGKKGDEVELIRLGQHLAKTQQQADDEQRSQ